jgi:hypothetical protein
VSDSNSRVFLARTVLARFLEYILDLIFPHLMSVNVRKPGFFINIKANLHLLYQNAIFGQFLGQNATLNTLA